MVTRLLRAITQPILCLALVCAALAAVSPWGRLAGFGPQPPDAYVRQQLERLQETDPRAAVTLRQLRDQRDARDIAVAMTAAEHGGGNQASALRELAVRAQKGRTPYEVRLAALARQSIDPGDQQAVETFFQAHATTCQMLIHDDSGQTLEFYLNLLAQASQDPVAWKIVRDDPVGLVLWPCLRNDPGAWQYYGQERQWLAEVLADMAPAQVNAGTVDAVEQSYAEAVRVARQYHPLPKQAVCDLKLGVYGFVLFLAYGPIIQSAVKDGVPLDEVLDVIFINGDSLALPADEPVRWRRAAELAGELALIRKTRPKVWEAARAHPLALRLNKDVPNYADQLLEKYAANDVCAFLYSNYENEIVPAAAALAHYGDLGFYILKNYEDDARLKTYLLDEHVGILVVPFLARFGSAGFDKLHEDPAWVRRYFNSDGTPRKDDWEWLGAVPILGAPALLVKNIAQGYPSQWSEWGWAGLDVADGVLLVASFGASAEVTAGKEVLKDSGEMAIEKVTRQEAKALTRRAGREAAEAAARTGGTTIARDVERSALRRVAGAGGLVLRNGGQVIVIAGRILDKAAEPAFAGARRLKQAWESVPPAFRRWAYRSLLAVGMIITIHERTIPALPKVGQAIGEEAGRLIGNSANATADALSAAMRQWLGDTPLARVITSWAGHALACFILLACAWRIAPWRRREAKVV